VANCKYIGLSVFDIVCLHCTLNLYKKNKSTPQYKQANYLSVSGRSRVFTSFFYNVCVSQFIGQLSLYLRLNTVNYIFNPVSRNSILTLHVMQCSVSERLESARKVRCAVSKPYIK